MENTNLDAPIETLKGVGFTRGVALNRIGIKTLRDLFYYFPRRYLDRSTVTPIRALKEDMGATTIIGRIHSQSIIEGGRMKRLEVMVSDASGAKLKCVWFKGVHWMQKVFKTGELVAFHGTPQKYGFSFSLAHPDFDKLDAEQANLDTGRIIPLYPSTAALEKLNLNSRGFRRIIYTLFKQYGLALKENLPTWIRDRYALMAGNVALRAIHFPKNEQELALAQRRLKFEEFFFLQLLLALTRTEIRKEANGHLFSKPKSLFKRFVAQLPFSLTNAQEKAIQDVIQDTTSGFPMNRLVQGDVGSGKTVVAIAAMMHALDAGFQSAFMAPTEILAEQHYANLQQYLTPLGVEVRLLIGGQRKKLREEILNDLASNTAQIAVGTHAIIQEGVTFQKLGLAIIDEQHRFGVLQRAEMFKKGARPHMLLMTATPIPRSLAMTLYGDLDVTVMNEMPAHRKPIKTVVRSEKRRGEVYDFLKKELREGRQAYVVYPLVEESEKLDLKDAENGFEHLQQHFRPYKVDLVHGRMLSYEKEEAMERFKSGETDILVATTVIEVGVDVPNATIMMIEHAERFGLSQLHQLRGRVGRGAQQSYCFLMAAYKQSEEARIRLRAMEASTDGFEISEIDLKIRGAGDFFGTRQSGLPDLKLADITKDADLLALAREAAFDLANKDPKLFAPEHIEMRNFFARTAPKSLGFAQIG